jgi:hypothetical protein
MRIPAVVLLLTLVAACGLCACVPDVVTIEAVPTPRFARDLAQCQAAVRDALWTGDQVKRCLQAKGYRFLKQY